VTATSPPTWWPASPEPTASTSDDDTHNLTALLAGADESPVVLTPEQEAAYRRLTSQALAMFHLNEPSPAFSTEGPIDDQTP
jgi:hypothetical protein